MKTVKTLKLTAFNRISKALTTIFRSPLYPVFFQVAGLIIYLGLIWFALGVAVPDGVPPKRYAQNTMSSLIVWGIWLPLLIILTAFLGRIWCSVCPLELIQQVGNFIGRKVFGIKLRLPKFFRNSINGVLIYSFLLFMLIATRFPQVPGNTSTLLIVLAFFSLVSGIFFGNRIFCKYFCPADMLLRGLGRRGMLRIHHELPKNAIVNTTASKDNCPSYLNTKKLNDASPCILCGHCIKSNESISVNFRAMPSVPDDNWKNYGWGITILGFFLSGFVIEHLFHDWQAGHHYYEYFPDIVKKMVGVKALAGWIEAIWAVIVIPVVFWFSMVLIGKIFSSSLSISDILKKITLPIITALTGLHVILSLKKFSHWVTHTQVAFKNLKDKIATDGFMPESIFIVHFHGRGHGHGQGQEVHLLSEPVFWCISIIILFLFSSFLFKEIWRWKKEYLSNTPSCLEREKSSSPVKQES
ncbi:MAG: 4Fe-4S binding protein [Desulfobulbus sp.]|jgi:hypothetical protein